MTLSKEIQFIMRTEQGIGKMLESKGEGENGGSAAVMDDFPEVVETPILAPVVEKVEAVKVENPASVVNTKPDEVKQEDSHAEGNGPSARPATYQYRLGRRSIENPALFEPRNRGRCAKGYENGYLDVDGAFILGDPPRYVTSTTKKAKAKANKISIPEGEAEFRPAPKKKANKKTVKNGKRPTMAKNPVKPASKPKAVSKAAPAQRQVAVPSVSEEAAGMFGGLEKQLESAIVIGVRGRISAMVSEIQSSLTAIFKKYE